MTDKLTLVPCGCGGKPILTESDMYDSFSMTYTVICDNCRIQTDIYEDENEAIEAWNKAMSGNVIVSKIEDGGVIMSDEPKLKPCPFCGTLPQTRVEISSMGGGSDRIDFSVICDKCGTRKKVLLYTAESKTFADVQEAMEMVTEIWNKRMTDE